MPSTQDSSYTLRFFNTLTRVKEDFIPVDPQAVRMYVCGPTVYDYAHIGNARPVIVFDLVFRLLRHRYGAEAVTYVRNFTDVDDKINARAARDFPALPLNEAIRRVTETTEAQYRKDTQALGVLAPTVEPRATGHIAEMRTLIERLVARGFAYVAENHVLFSVAAMQAAARENSGRLPRYGALARRSLDDMLAGARVDVAPYKRDAMDFVLWKPSGAHEPGWESPAGIAVPGRPGWHIECSAMSWRHLVERFAGRIRCDDPAASGTFDIHAGGIDLVFPHHENEIAQTCCALDTPRMANYWLHNGLLQVEGEKMSKSLGNFITIHDLLEKDVFGGRAWPGAVLRFAMLRTHYRQPIDWTVKGLEESAATLAGWARAVDGVEAAAQPPHALLEALADDLNTHMAITVLHGLKSAGDLAGLKAGLDLLGFDLSPLAREAETPPAGLDAAAIEAAIAARKAARGAKDWAEADRIRKELAERGVTLVDNKDGTTSWTAA
ncbi:MAG: cysteine--tRNA ligase [Pseudochelatococcus sp.]|jgi:cysteinyl-tRNA synthetase|uniref:cysteine--tRNA ligase n=1 Tax=Pseudochelatococcus sp. TaxID=2020869 RepID=UPI003D8A05D3